MSVYIGLQESVDKKTQHHRKRIGQGMLETAHFIVLIKLYTETGV